MESFIHFIIKYNEKIIYLTGGFICFLSVVVVWWQVFGKKSLNTGHKPELDLSDIEASLKKILSQTNNAIQTVTIAEGAAAAAGGGVGGSSKIDGVTTLEGRPVTDVAGVKAELLIRAKLIQDLQAEVKSAKSDDSSIELLAKIKDLEGKLAEYEIIEDDIADLSFFKEENSKLKKELDQLKRADASMVDQFADEVAKAKVEPKVEEDLVSEPKPSATPTEPSADVLAAAIAEIEPIQDPATLEDLDTLPPPDEVGASAGSTNASLADAKDDIFGEFSKDLSGDTSDPLAELGDIDPDRMLDELKDLNANLDIGSEALNEDPDMDKMAEEAEHLPKKG